MLEYARCGRYSQSDFLDRAEFGPLCPAVFHLSIRMPIRAISQKVT
jgi:hypothetical protein